MVKKAKLAPVEKPQLLKLDLGCGTNKYPGFTGVDVRAFDGVDIVADMRQPWPWTDGSVEEVWSSHFIEHLSAPERIHFVNELYRVLIPGGKATLIAPYAFSERAYGDLTHQWPPVVGLWFFYLNKEWRAVNAPHNDAYNCDFHATWGWSLHPAVASRNQEFQQFALQFYREAAQDIHATLIKK